METFHSPYSNFVVIFVHCLHVGSIFYSSIIKLTPPFPCPLPSSLSFSLSASHSMLSPLISSQLISNHLILIMASKSQLTPSSLNLLYVSMSACSKKMLIQAIKGICLVCRLTGCKTLCLC